MNRYVCKAPTTTSFFIENICSKAENYKINFNSKATSKKIKNRTSKKRGKCSRGYMQSVPDSKEINSISSKKIVKFMIGKLAFKCVCIQ